MKIKNLFTGTLWRRFSDYASFLTQNFGGALFRQFPLANKLCFHNKLFLDRAVDFFIFASFDDTFTVFHLGVGFAAADSSSGFSHTFDARGGGCGRGVGGGGGRSGSGFVASGSSGGVGSRGHAWGGLFEGKNKKKKCV